MNAPLTERTVQEVLVANLARSDDRPFLTLIQGEGRAESFSYGDLLARAAAWAGLYRARGLDRGDRIVVILRHSVDLYAAYLGAIVAGMVPAMFAHPSPKLSEQEYFRTIGDLLRSARARLVVTYPELAAKLAEPLDRLPTVEGAVLADDLPCPRADIAAAMANAAPDDCAFLQYSSGTTGLKKGVAISHRAVIWQLRAYADAIDASARDVIVSWLPLYHDMGLIACFFLPIALRSRLVAMSPFDWVRRPALWAEAVTEYRGTLAWLPNFAFNFMARNVADVGAYDFASLRGVVNCSEPILAASHDAFLARFRPCGFKAEALSVCYAMAETTFAATSGGFGRAPAMDWIDDAAFARTGRAHAVDPGTPGARRLVGSGRALTETEIAIRDDNGENCGDRRLGEIALRSPCLFAEYDGNPTATAAALQDGWCLTGDLGYLAHGELFVVGRKKDLIIVGGQNVYPQDFEALVNDVEGIVAGRTVAIGIDDPESGTEKLVVLAETTLGAAEQGDLARRIHRRIAEASEVVARDTRLVAPGWLRKSTSGKISRNANRAKYLAMISAEQRPAAPPPAAPMDQSLRDNVRQAVLRELARLPGVAAGEIDDGRALISSGLVDSFGVVSLLQAVEAATGIAIPDGVAADVAAIDTIAGLAATVERSRRGDIPARSLGTWPGSADDIELAAPDYTGTPRTRGGFWTWYYKLVFRRHGIRYGRGLRVMGPLLLRLDGEARNIRLGDNVTLMPWVDLKVREEGQIILGHGTVLDTMVRLVAANDARLELGDRAQLGIGSVINAGADVIIGRDTVTAGYCSIIASEHNFESRDTIMSQGYRHQPVYLGADVWLATNVLVCRGSRIGDGAVIAAQSVVNGDIPAYAIAAGNPARIVRSRR